MSSTIESRRDLKQADQEMHSLLDGYEKLSKTKRIRRPLDLNDYKWDQARPELTYPAVIDSLRFTFQVEVPSDLYAQPILQAADREGLSSLRRFIERTWLPEERKHGVLLGQAALAYGAITQEEYDRDLVEIPKLDFPIGRGFSVGRVVKYGETQEEATKLYYKAMRKNTQDPLLITVLTDLEAQEMFHHKVYSDFSRKVATGNDVVENIRQFQMPGYVTSPAYQKQSNTWAHELGFDLNAMYHDLATGILEQAGYSGLGRVVSSEIIRNSFPEPVKSVLSIVDRINNPLLNYLEGRVAARIARVKSAT